MQNTQEKSKIDLRGFKGFLIQSNERQSVETLSILSICILEDIPYTITKDNNPTPNDLYIPVGSVEFCLSYIGHNIIPDYYPEFLSDTLHRIVWKTDEWPLGNSIFIKPADRYKRFTGFVTNGGYRKKKRGPYWCSEVVHFINEYRYYVSNGKEIDAAWYSGKDSDSLVDPLRRF